MRASTKQEIKNKKKQNKKIKQKIISLNGNAKAKF